MFLRIAISNLWRNKRRTIITELSIVIGIFVIVFAGAVTNGMSENWAKGAIESYTGSMQVEHQNYEKERKFKPLETTLHGGHKLTIDVRIWIDTNDFNALAAIHC